MSTRLYRKRFGAVRYVLSAGYIDSAEEGKFFVLVGTR